MICTDCARAADRAAPELPHCRECNRHVQVFRTDALPNQQRLVFHKKDGERCPGVGSAPIYRPYGHCWARCDCQHRPSGSYRGVRAA